MLDKWMKFELETIYGAPLVILYDSDRYRNDSRVIVMDKKTADFWFSIIDEVKMEKCKNESIP